MRHKNEEYFALLENFINEYTIENGRSPSNRDMASGTGLSTATVSRYLQYMREQGMLDYDGQRNIRTLRQQKMSDTMVEVPILGTIACGIPNLAEENIEEYVQLPVSVFGKGNFYLLHANGESMIDAGIEDGDLVLVSKQNYADEGQIVVALIDDEATLKRYYPEPQNHRVRLHPENKTMEDIYVENCIIQGVAVKVLKDLV